MTYLLNLENTHRIYHGGELLIAHRVKPLARTLASGEDESPRCFLLARLAVTRTNSLIPAFPIDAFPEGNRRAINILGLLWKGAPSINDRRGAARGLLPSRDPLGGTDRGDEQVGDDGRERASAV